MISSCQTTVGHSSIRVTVRYSVAGRWVSTVVGIVGRLGVGWVNGIDRMYCTFFFFKTHERFQMGQHSSRDSVDQPVSGSLMYNTIHSWQTQVEIIWDTVKDFTLVLHIQWSMWLTYCTKKKGNASHSCRSSRAGWQDNLTRSPSSPKPAKPPHRHCSPHSPTHPPTHHHTVHYCTVLYQDIHNQQPDVKYIPICYGVNR